MVKKVYLIFKTHLDIGFTNFGDVIVDTYLHSFIPGAIRRCYELKDTDTPYLWTTGSWLIWEALKQDTDGTLDKAIQDGLIAWHAMPFTTFTESMSPELMEYALSLSDQLDARYGRKTIAAKMSDVPGHTKALIPYLARHGVKFLHLGINGVYAVPGVPPVFRWKNGNDEVIVMYQKGYGREMAFEDFAIAFGFTGDNRGPQSREAVEALYADLRARYPGAEVVASTLSDVAEALETIRDSLPVVEDEIGDLWIQNVGTDPKKVSLYKELLRHIEKNGVTGDISDNLLVVPEHTWGGDVKVFFPDYIHYSVEELKRTEDEPRRKDLERTWEEKRELIDNAQKALGTDFRYEIEKPDLTGYERAEGEPDFELSWQLFDKRDYDRYLVIHGIGRKINPHMTAEVWSMLDNSKFGIPGDIAGIFTAGIKNIWKKDGTTLYEMAFDEKTAAYHGLPEIWAEQTEDMLTVKFFGQKANRLPQAFWLKFKGMEESWEINKIGQWMDTEAVANPFLMATTYGVRNPKVEIETLDSLLVAPHGRMMLDTAQPPLVQDMYFNLYNNTWGCNQPMWYSGDSIFRFRFTKR